MNELELFEDDLNKIIDFLNYKIHSLWQLGDLSKEDLQKILYIIFNEKINNEQNILISSLIMSLLHNYFELIKTKEESNNINDIIDQMNQIFIVTRTNILKNTLE